MTILTDMEKQVRWTIHAGSGDAGRARVERWKSAAAVALKDPKLLANWIRQTLDREADRLLSPKK